MTDPAIQPIMLLCQVSQSELREKAGVDVTQGHQALTESEAGCAIAREGAAVPHAWARSTMSSDQMGG